MVHPIVTWAKLDCALMMLLVVMFAGPACADDEGAGALDSLQTRIWELRGEGRYQEAHAAAVVLASRHSQDESLPAWAGADDEWLVATLEFIAALSDSAHQRLSEADRLQVQMQERYGQNDFPGGLQLAQRRLAVLENFLGERFPEVATAQVDVGSGLLRTDNFLAAESYFRDALALRLKLLPAAHPDLSTSYYHVAVLLHRQGDYQGAADHIREALRVARACWGDDHLNTVRYMSSLGSDLLGQGDYVTAEVFFRKALVQYRKLLDGDHFLIANNLDGLAATLKMKGELADAEQYYRQSLAMRQRVLPANHPDIAWSLSNVAGILYESKDLAGAEELLRQALEILYAYLGDGAEHLDLALLMKNLAQITLEQRNLEEAESLFRQALEILERVVGKHYRSYAGVQHDLANVLCRRNQFAAADSLFGEALEAYRAFLGEEHPTLAWCLRDQAMCLYAAGQVSSAVQRLEQAAAIFEIARQRAGTGFERATFATSPYTQLAAAHLLQGTPELAWPAAEKGMARALADLLRVPGQRSLSTSELDQEESLQRELSQLEGRIAVFQEARARDASEEVDRNYRDLRHNLLAVEAEWSAFQREMATRYPVTEGQAFPRSRVGRSLPRGTALLGWLRTEIAPEVYVTWGYVLRKEGAVHWCEMPMDSILADGSDPTVLAFRKTLAEAAAWPFRVTDVDRVEVLAQELHAHWLAPLLPHLDGVEELVILPAGPMLGVPVEVLADSEGISVGERFVVSYAPSATIYTWLLEQDVSRSLASPAALLMGDPLCSPRLPWSRIEVEKVAEVIPGATTLLDSTFSEPMLADLAASDQLRDYDILHLATHALIDEARPERSALVLAQANLPDPLEAAIADEPVYDGYLTVQEIVRHWQLDADLVTLSGCGTALGREAAGEGYLGFTNTFLQIGTRSLVVSLWRVEDRATSQLMGRFYQNLVGDGTEHNDSQMNKAQALREAKQWLRSWTDESGIQIYRHPAYWSGFVLIGDPR